MRASTPQITPAAPVAERLMTTTTTTNTKETTKVDTIEVRAVITSYGVRHGTAPEPVAARTVRVDLTTALRNPASDPRMIDLTGLDRPVREHVMATPGARQILAGALEEIAAALADLDDSELLEVFTFCQGGRHRSVAIAEEIAAALRSQRIGCEVEHLDVNKPVLR